MMTEAALFRPKFSNREFGRAISKGIYFGIFEAFSELSFAYEKGKSNSQRSRRQPHT